MDNIASKLSLDENYKSNNFFVQLIFRPSAPNNITNWSVFKGNAHILHFLHCEYTFKYIVIDEGYHDEEINKETPRNDTSHSNVIAPLVVRMEHLYDLHEKFKTMTNCKKDSSTMQYKMINLDSEKDPKNVNLGLGCTPIK